MHLNMRVSLVVVAIAGLTLSACGGDDPAPKAMTEAFVAATAAVVNTPEAANEVVEASTATVEAVVATSPETGEAQAI